MPFFRRLLIALTVSTLTAGAVLMAGAAREAVAPLSETVQLKARIVQLEGQLAQAQQQATLCEARLTLASGQQTQATQQQQRIALEKEAGCALDWSATPPICKPTKGDAK